MKKADVKVGSTYMAKVSGTLAEVRITGENAHGGWDAVNVATKRPVRIKSAQRLRGPAVPKKTAGREHMKAVHHADQANARLDEQRAAGGDGMTASERAMAESEADAGKAGSGRKPRQAYRLTGTERVELLTAKQAKARNLCRKDGKQWQPDESAADRATEPKAIATGQQRKRRLAEGNRKDRTAAAEARKQARARKTAAKAAGSKRMSCLDAAARVLHEAGEPLSSQAMVDRMAAAGYWSSDAATPQNTLYAAILREINKKGAESRFEKVGKGLFAPLRGA
jgi:hypothetical protein